MCMLYPENARIYQLIRVYLKDLEIIFPKKNIEMKKSILKKFV